MARLSLTLAEAEHVAWAFGAMHDYWGAACEPGAAPDPEAEGVADNDLSVPAGAAMPFLTGSVLTLSTWDEINEDLVYRVGSQLPDMATDAVSIGGDMSPQRAAGIVRTCASLAAKIAAR